MKKDIDQLLFNYLEDTLSHADRHELESQLASDPLLQAELDEWKKTYLKEEEEIE